MSSLNSSEQAPTVAERCGVCGRPVLVAINRGSGVCSEDCRKARAAEVKIP